MPPKILRAGAQAQLSTQNPEAPSFSLLSIDQNGDTVDGDTLS